MSKKKLEARAQKDEKKDEIDEETAMNTRELLLKRLKGSTIKVPFKAGDTEFNIEVRVLSPAEQSEIMKIQVELIQFRSKMQALPKGQKNAAKVAKTGQALLGKFYSWVGKICVDPNLNAEYWKKGEGFSIDVPLKLMSAAVSQSQDYTKQIRSFREKQ